MGISFDKALQPHASALALRSQRAQLLADNIANADTPGYKARDLDFKALLAAADGGQPRLERTHARHLDLPGATASGAVAKYRVPSSPSVDGNTVEAEAESMAFLDNALRYQASLNFIDGTLASIRSALRGE